MGQAKNDAEHLNIRYAYASNRLKIYGVHMDEGAEGDVDRIPTPDELLVSGIFRKIDKVPC